MSNDVLKVAISQYRKARTELAQIINDLPAFHNMREWEKIIIAQGGKIPVDNDNGEVKRGESTTASSKIIPQPKKKKPSGEGKLARVKEHAIQFIRKNGGHAQRPDIIRYLSSQGISISAGSLGVLLSTSPEFKSDRKLGWSVKESAV